MPVNKNFSNNVTVSARNLNFWCCNKSMLTLLLLSLLIETLLALPHLRHSNCGSSLFYNRRSRGCWDRNELAKLRARKVFEQLELPALPPDRVDDAYLKDTLKYFKNSLKHIETNKYWETRQVLRDALADTFGANLRSNILPTARFAYYAGYVHYKNVKQMHDFSEKMKNILNTQGLGWKEPARLPGWSNLSVAKITIGSGKLINPCTYLSIKRDENHCVTLPYPQLDDPDHPSAIALPFKSVKVFSMTAPVSENVLLKYYTTASRCILQRSPKNCRHSDFVNFNNEMWHWMKTDVAPHLLDEKLYSIFGGVLRIAAAVQSYGRGLKRRGVLTFERSNDTRWIPYLTDSRVKLDVDWTPSVYICFTVIAALLIFMLQIFYGKVFSKGSDGCNCSVCPTNPKRSPNRGSQVYYANVDSNFPAMLPQYPQADVFLREKQPSTREMSSKSLESPLDENKRQATEVPRPCSDRGSSESEQTISSKDTSKVSYESETHTDRSSPPELATPIYQLKVSRNQVNPKETCSDSTGRARTENLSESSSSGSGGSASGESRYSISTKSSCHSTRKNARVRRFVSRHSLCRSSYSKTPPGAEDVNSYTTPPSGR